MTGIRSYERGDIVQVRAMDLRRGVPVDALSDPAVVLEFRCYRDGTLYHILHEHDNWRQVLAPECLVPLSIGVQPSPQLVKLAEWLRDNPDAPIPYDVDPRDED